ncbi:hypothetical protein AAMO2058_000699700 [Amorphochlora amoebiformis]
MHASYAPIGPILLLLAPRLCVSRQTFGIRGMRFHGATGSSQVYVGLSGSISRFGSGSRGLRRMNARDVGGSPSGIEEEEFLRDLSEFGILQQLRSRGLSTEGSKADKLERLVEDEKTALGDRITQDAPLDEKVDLRTVLDLDPEEVTSPEVTDSDSEIETASLIDTLQSGAVLIAKKDANFDHFYSESCILVLEDHPQQGTVGLLIDNNTPWEVGEMAPVFEDTKLANVPLNMGGGDGPDKLLMLHNIPELEGAVPIGDSGVYIGGVTAAVQLVERGDLEPDQFHFFFKRCEWLPGALQKEINQELWKMAKVSPHLLLKQKGRRKRKLWNDLRSRLLKKTNKPASLL